MRRPVPWSQRQREAGKRHGRGQKIALDNLSKAIAQHAQSRDLAAAAVAISEAVFVQAQADATHRKQAAGKSHGRGQKIGLGKLPKAIAQPIHARELAAAAVGWSGKTYAKARAVVTAAAGGGHAPWAGAKHSFW
jgi:hypothetical protein